MATVDMTQKNLEFVPKIRQKQNGTFSKRFKRSKYFLLMLLPCLLYFAIFHYLPMFGIVVSFKNYNLFRGVWASDWVGFSHYVTFFQSKDFWILYGRSTGIG